MSLDLCDDGVDVDRLAGINLDEGCVEVQWPGLRGCPAGDHLLGLMFWEMARVSVGRGDPSLVPGYGELERARQ